MARAADIVDDRPVKANRGKKVVPAGREAVSRFRRSLVYAARGPVAAIRDDVAAIRRIDAAAEAVETRHRPAVFLKLAVSIFAGAILLLAVVIFGVLDLSEMEGDPAAARTLFMAFGSFFALLASLVGAKILSDHLVRPESLNVKNRRYELIDRLLGRALDGMLDDRPVTVRAGLAMDDHDPERPHVAPLVTDLGSSRWTDPWLSMELTLPDGDELAIRASERIRKRILTSTSDGPVNKNIDRTVAGYDIGFDVNLAIDVRLRPEGGLASVDLERTGLKLPKRVKLVELAAREGALVVRVATARTWTERGREPDRASRRAARSRRSVRHNGDLDAADLIRRLIAALRAASGRDAGGAAAL